jgi:tryptophan synthase alpha chain
MIRFPKPALILYLTSGFPSLAITRDVALAAIDAGTDVIELGVPFSDPVADGPVIQRASEIALRNGVSLKDVIDLGASIKQSRPSSHTIIFSYLNPILRYGLPRFAQDAAAAGLDGALITDLIIEESAEYRRIMQQHGLATIFLIAPTTADLRIRKIAQLSSGFIYAVSRTGVTGAQQATDLQGEARQLVRRIRKHSTLPIAVGFGISTPQQCHEASGFADAVVVGSAVVKLIEDHPGTEAKAVADWIKSLKQANTASTGPLR